MGDTQRDRDVGRSAFPIITPQNRRFKMVVDPSHADYYRRNGFEDFTADLILAYTKSGAVFIDVGAHYGYYSLLVGSQVAGVTLWAFEPAPRNYELLKQNFSLNGLAPTHLLQIAISDKEGTGDYQITSHSSHCGFYTHSISSTVETVSVRCETLDRCLGGRPNGPTVIKIDTEGHEIRVLDGMKEIFVTIEDLILFIEFNPPSLKSAGYDPGQLFAKLAEYGFDVFLIDDERRETYKLSEDRWNQWPTYFDEGNYKKDYFNIVCYRKSRALSVCLFSHSSESGGAEQALLELTKELIQDHGALCTVVFPNDGPLVEKCDEMGAATVTLDYTWWSRLGLATDKEIEAAYFAKFGPRARAIMRKLARINPDVVLTNTMVIPWGAVAASGLNKPHVWFIHEFGRLDLDFYLPRERIIEIIRASSDVILTNSNAVMEELFGTTTPKNIVAIPQYVDVRTENPGNGAVHFRRADATKVIVLGRISPHKGQEDAVLAVGDLVRKGRDVELVIIGASNASYLARLQDIVVRQGLDQFVAFEGFQPDVFAAMNEADIVLTCTRNEAFGRVALEAMWLKKPVVGANTGGTPELVRDGFNGLLYEPGDHDHLARQIEYLIDHREKAAEFGENGYRFVKENFTKERFGGQVHRLLKELRDSSSSAARSRDPFFQFLTEQMLANVGQMEGEIASLQATLQSQQQELDKIRSSLGWRVTERLNAFVDGLFPVGSGRRRVLTRLAGRIRGGV